MNGITIKNPTSAGIFVESANGETVGATIEGGTSITGGPTGILVSGANASLAFSGANPATLSQTGNYITLADGAMAGQTIDATNVTFDSYSPASLSDMYAVEGKITDYLDNSTLGYVSLNSTNVYVAYSSEQSSAGAVQRGINVAPTNVVGTVNVQAGTYVANADYDNKDAGVVDELNITRPLTLLGAQAGVDPNGTPPSTADQTIIQPGNSDPNPYDSTAVTVIGVSSSDVTIDGVTVDGSNTATPGFKHASGAPSLDGTTIDASEGISSYVDVGSITIRNDIVENTAYMGVDFMNGPSFSGAATDHNVVADNLIQNLSDAYGFGVGVCLYDNFYAAVTNNVISNVFVGVQTGNFSQGNPDDAASISQNQISAGVRAFSTT